MINQSNKNYDIPIEYHCSFIGKSVKEEIDEPTRFFFKKISSSSPSLLNLNLFILTNLKFSLFK